MGIRLVPSSGAFRSHRPARGWKLLLVSHQGAYDQCSLSDHIAPQGDGNNNFPVFNPKVFGRLSDHIAPQGDGNYWKKHKKVFSPNAFRSHRPARGWKHVLVNERCTLPYFPITSPRKGMETPEINQVRSESSPFRSHRPARGWKLYHLQA